MGEKILILILLFFMVQTVQGQEGQNGFFVVPDTQVNQGDVFVVSVMLENNITSTDAIKLNISFSDKCVLLNDSINDFWNSEFSEIIPYQNSVFMQSFIFDALPINSTSNVINLTFFANSSGFFSLNFSDLTIAFEGNKFYPNMINKTIQIIDSSNTTEPPIPPVNNSINNETDNTTNNPPNQPSNPYPVDGTINVTLNDTLSWICSDPDNDTLIYDVYFGTSSNPPLVSINQSENYYVPTMSNDTLYYWEIVAFDNHGASNNSPLWNFTSDTPPIINPEPNEPSIEQPIEPTTETPIEPETITGGSANTDYKVISAVPDNNLTEPKTLTVIDNQTVSYTPQSSINSQPEKVSQTTPGFEFILLFLAISLIIIFERRKH
jgi:hypothetical protein